MPGAVVLVTTADQRWETAVGVLDRDAETPMRTGLRWPLRSITKSFTVTLVLQLVDEGVISLDDTVDRWIDGVPNGDRITIRELADMTSGLSDYTNARFVEDFVANPGRVFTLDELIAYSTEQPACAEPGSDRVYTNVNTLLLGRIVEVASGRSFAEALHARILDRLDLGDTTYPLGTDQWTADEVGYSPDGDTLSAEPVNFSVFGPAGAMISTTDDLARWGAALVDGTLLDPATRSLRRKGGPLDEGPEYDRYALGIGEIDGWWGHTGEGFGFTALVMRERSVDTTVVVVMNVSQLDRHGPTAVFRALVPILNGHGTS